MPLQNKISPPPSSLKEMMAGMLDTGLFSDIALIVGSKDEECRFNAHKMVLGGRSEVFRTMMQKRWMNGEHVQSDMEVIRLPTHSVAAFKIFLRYLYTDELITPDNVKDALEVLKLSHLYETPGLLTVIKNLLETWINADNCLQIYMKSRIIDDKLSQTSFLFFLRNIRSAVEKEQYLGWDAETVKTVLSQEFLKIREVDLFKALLKWGNHKDELGDNITFPRSKAMPELMKMIQIPNIGMQDFATEVVPTGVFSDKEVVKMFLHFANPQSEYTTIRKRQPSVITVFPTSLGSFTITQERPVKNKVSTRPNPKDYQKGAVFQFGDRRRPEISLGCNYASRLQLSRTIHLHGIGVRPCEINEDYFGLLGGLSQFELNFFIENEEGMIVAKKTEEMPKFKALPKINLDDSVVLRKGNAYDFYISCKQVNDNTPHNVGVNCRVKNLFGTKSIDLGNGVGTITYNDDDCDTWIRQIMFSFGSEESKPCNIT